MTITSGQKNGVDQQHIIDFLVLLLGGKDEVTVPHANFCQRKIDSRGERRVEALDRLAESNASNAGALSLGLGATLPVTTCDMDGLFCGEQIPEPEISARAVTPFPFPRMQLLNTDEELDRLAAVWRASDEVTERISNRRVRLHEGGSSVVVNCDVCSNPAIPDLVVCCNATSCSKSIHTACFDSSDWEMSGSSEEGGENNEYYWCHDCYLEARVGQMEPLPIVDDR
jgi:hypothetical protein